MPQGRVKPYYPGLQRVLRQQSWRVRICGPTFIPYITLELGFYGTLPELVVMQWLYDHGIYFESQRVLDMNQVRREWVLPPEIGNSIRPDIWIPGLAIVLEIQGYYWHSSPEAVRHDALKEAIYEQVYGFRCYKLWDVPIGFESETDFGEVETRVDEIMWNIPEIANALRSGDRSDKSIFNTPKQFHDAWLQHRDLYKPRKLRAEWRQPRRKRKPPRIDDKTSWRRWRT